MGVSSRIPLRRYVLGLVSRSAIQRRLTLRIRGPSMSGEGRDKLLELLEQVIGGCRVESRSEAKIGRIPTVR